MIMVGGVSRKGREVCRVSIRSGRVIKKGW